MVPVAKELKKHTLASSEIYVPRTIAANPYSTITFAQWPTFGKSHAEKKSFLLNSFEYFLTITFLHLIFRSI